MQVAADVVAPQGELQGLVAVHNVTEQPQRASPMVLYLVGHDHPVDRLTGQPARVDHGQVVLDPYQAVWLTAP